MTEQALLGTPGTWVAQGPAQLFGGTVENLFDGTEMANAPANNARHSTTVGSPERPVSVPVGSSRRSDTATTTKATPP